MVWIIKHKDGFDFGMAFASYAYADQYLRANILKGFDGGRNNYFICTMD